MKTITIDPKDFISPPYIECPKCGKRSWGILHIAPHAYSRRCRECMFPHPSRNEPDAWFDLPPLNKKVIYLDQFAISNMMKVINPKMKAYKKKTVDEFWLALFKKLNRLCQLQLVVCPDSIFQEDESLLSPYFKALREMYRLLSYGLSFKNPTQIKIIQLCEHAKNYMEGNPEKELSLKVQDVVNEEINVWQDTIRFDVDLGPDLPWKESSRKTRDLIYEEFVKIFRRWETEKDKTFDDWFEEENSIAGPVILRGFAERTANFWVKVKYNIELEANDMFSSESQLIVKSLLATFESRGFQGRDSYKKVREYLTSPTLKEVPFIRIFASLCAALAHEAAHEGRKKEPSPGMYTDLTMISLLLPYCDAIFIDNECRGLLEKIPKHHKFDYGTKVFSLSNKDEFLKYLDEIETQASEEHLNKVREVYGENWPKPFVELYTYRQK